MIDIRWMESIYRDQGFSVSSTGALSDIINPWHVTTEKKESWKVPNFRGSYCLRSLEGQSTGWITEVHSFCQCYNSYQSSTVKTVNNTVVT